MIALVLAIRTIVPAGTMLTSDSKVITVQVCADAQGLHFAKQITVPMTKEHRQGGGDEPSVAKGVCAFSSLAMAALSGADAPLLALAIGFILALGFAPIHSPLLSPIARARPPLRAPPRSRLIDRAASN